MAEQVFRSPGYFDAEQDRSVRQELGPAGTPAGLVGASTKGPAFVPITVRNFDVYRQVFGDLDSRYAAPYAANEYLKHRTALTFLRVLGAGSLDTSGDVSRYKVTGQANNAGFVVTGSAAANDTSGRHMGAVQFLVARHALQANEAFGMPVFTNNATFAGSIANLVRGVILTASGTRVMVLDGDQAAVGAFGATTPDDVATIASSKFKLVLSSSNGASFGTADGNIGVKIFTASLDPSSSDYFAKLLNTDPDKFAAEQHMVYADYAVDNEMAAATTVAIFSGSANTSTSSGNSTMVFRDTFGHFDTKFQTPSTTYFVSQPFGKTEYDLFKIEALDDGEYANTLYKISISDLKMSSDPTDPYGTFSVLVRSWDDDDLNPTILEQYAQCSLDPTSERYVAKLIGDRKLRFNFESENVTERRLVATGKYGNRSQFVRVVMNEQVERKLVPAKSLPFGFRGVEVLKTNDATTDRPQAAGLVRLTGAGNGSTAGALLSGSVVPPVPFRFKVTRGDAATSGFLGNPGTTELANANFYWGVKFERNSDPLNPNLASDKNGLLASLARFAGIRKLDALVTGSGADDLCNNKFTLAKVALSNAALTDLTGTIETHMREAAYVRNATVDPNTYTVNDGTLTARLTLASLAAATSSVDFNRFSPFAKFTTFMQGGFDGTNILDKAARRMNDRATSFDLGGGAESSYVSPGLAQNQGGTGPTNNAVAAYKTAVDIMTDPMQVNANILAVPGIKEPYLTAYVAQKAKDYGLAVYLMDVPSYDDSSNRLFDDSTGRPDVQTTARQFETRALDSNVSAAYFPDVFLDDTTNKKRVRVPASVCALAALGYNDRVSFPWFAPAGFNRAALDFVKNTTVRLSSGDRDVLYDARLNPISSFPRANFVIYGQKTLQASKSALDRVNVRRMLLEVKRIVVDVAKNLVFEQNTAEARNQFVRQASTRLGIIQTQAGVESFSVVMDGTNNDANDEAENRVNGRIVVVPTRTIEFVSLTFVITASGIEFTQ